MPALPTQPEALVSPDDIPTEITRMTYRTTRAFSAAGLPVLSQNQTAILLAHYWPAIEQHISAAVRSAALNEAGIALAARHCCPESVDLVHYLIDHQLCPGCEGYGQTVTNTPDGGIIRRCRTCNRAGLIPLAAAPTTTTEATVEITINPDPPHVTEQIRDLRRYGTPPRRNKES